MWKMLRSLARLHATFFSEKYLTGCDECVKKLPDESPGHVIGLNSGRFFVTKSSNIVQTMGIITLKIYN